MCAHYICSSNIYVSAVSYHDTQWTVGPLITLSVMILLSYQLAHYNWTVVAFFYCKGIYLPI